VACGRNDHWSQLALALVTPFTRRTVTCAQSIAREARADPGMPTCNFSRGTLQTLRKHFASTISEPTTGATSPPERLKSVVMDYLDHWSNGSAAGHVLQNIAETWIESLRRLASLQDIEGKVMAVENNINMCICMGAQHYHKHKNTSSQNLRSKVRIQIMAPQRSTAASRAVHWSFLFTLSLHSFESLILVCGDTVDRPHC
jgi:hypothetical protein